MTKTSIFDENVIFREKCWFLAKLGFQFEIKIFDINFYFWAKIASKISDFKEFRQKIDKMKTYSGRSSPMLTGEKTGFFLSERILIVDPFRSFSLIFSLKYKFSIKNQNLFYYFQNVVKNKMIRIKKNVNQKTFNF